MFFLGLKCGILTVGLFYMQVTSASKPAPNSKCPQAPLLLACCWLMVVCLVAFVFCVFHKKSRLLMQWQLLFYCREWQVLLIVVFS